MKSKRVFQQPWSPRSRTGVATRWDESGWSTIARSELSTVGSVEEPLFQFDGTTEERDRPVEGRPAQRLSFPIELALQPIDEVVEEGVVVQLDPLRHRELRGPRTTDADRPATVRPFRHDQHRQRLGVSGTFGGFGHDGM